MNLVLNQDYVQEILNIIILYLNEDEMNKVFIQNKILEKYNNIQMQIIYYSLTCLKAYFLDS